MANRYWNGSSSVNSDDAGNWETEAGAPLGDIPAQGDHVFFIGARCASGYVCNAYDSYPLEQTGGYTEDAAYAARNPQTLAGDPPPIVVLGGICTLYKAWSIAFGGFQPTTLKLHNSIDLQAFGGFTTAYVYDDKTLLYCIDAIFYGYAAMGAVYLMSKNAKVSEYYGFMGDHRIDSTLAIPAVGNVRDGVAFGFEAALEGTLDIESDNPEEADVRKGVEFGNGKIGTLVVPRRLVGF